MSFFFNVVLHCPGSTLLCWFHQVIVGSYFFPLYSLFFFYIFYIFYIFYVFSGFNYFNYYYFLAKTSSFVRRVI